MRRTPLAILVLPLAACPPTPEQIPHWTSDEPGGSSSSGGSGGSTMAPTTGPGGQELPGAPAPEPLIQHVDPFVGTGGVGYGVGSAFPGPQVPFGLARPGPDTTLAGGVALGFAHCAGYHYDDAEVQGFSQTRMHGTGIVDYGHVRLMPTLGFSAAKTETAGYRRALDKASERASPGYYAVTLADGIGVELTATARVGLHRFTFPAGEDPVLLLDLAHTLSDTQPVDGLIEVDPSGEVRGFHQISGGYSKRFGGVTIHYALRTSRPPVGFGTWAGGAPEEGATAAKGPESGAYLRFSPGEPVTVAVGLSFVDAAHAAMNLEAEAAALDFDAARAAAEATWEEQLARARVRGERAADFKSFYTALYHTLLMPTLASDVDGSYVGLDGAVHTSPGPYYTDFSLWDTFRTLHPLLTLLYPEIQEELLRSLTRMAQDGGYMPRWPLGTGYTGGMDGESATVVFADSVVKGISPQAIGLAEAYAAMRATATAPVPPGAPYPGRTGVTEYMEKGYVPIEAGGGSASWTLESAYNDFALAALAEALGEAEDAAMFRARAGHWKGVWDPASELLIGRHADGSFAQGVDPLVWQDFYAEGNALQYVWYAPHDLAGLAEVMGGPAAALDRLHHFFVDSAAEPVGIMPQKYYWQGNEPDIHAPFIFSALGDHAGSARWSRWVLRERYGAGPAGLPGNDDGGTMSAWLVFASLGVFPIAGTETYLLGSPLFSEATLELPGGTLRIVAPVTADEATPVAVTWAGEPLVGPWIAHSTLAAGGELRFNMSAP